MPLEDPLLSYKFWVELETEVVGGFSECSGLQAETEVTDWLEGGDNMTVLKFPGRTKYGNLTLKHGFSQNPDLWLWFMRVLKGTFERRPLTVMLIDPTGAGARHWTFARAFPVKWVGPELRATTNGVAIESVEFAHEGILGL
jgi:phage tail-like protein